ncbi:hypothetical protein HMPREF3047_00450 [Neisseria sp. HMSC075C10]|uniref:Uncharacterized protein n=1 Tax=Neisseria mucosa C102 TaxID=435832 RepID=A0ABN0CBP3_NEIMU|nr:hypothetical protein HMPREF0604_01073 [Neisseria mucosa C102]OFM23293.1 hypothetical protein HMPREF2711_03015 [Neisseria sp. HMSC070A01]OFO41902.1 hypothetical protein HMPREF3047_00450 [Neisseria sp. HMSC075C10]OHP50298.1 hypothetical protein HMPREF2661_04595 [Neisseria sp. HMSC061B04]OHQ58257.1 hypothetical protein HMPREF2606_00895 [Neisseria sp. HMSC070H10]
MAPLAKFILKVSESGIGGHAFAWVEYSNNYKGLQESDGLFEDFCVSFSQDGLESLCEFSIIQQNIVNCV